MEGGWRLEVGKAAMTARFLRFQLASICCSGRWRYRYRIISFCVQLHMSGGHFCGSFEGSAIS